MASGGRRRFDQRDGIGELAPGTARGGIDQQRRGSEQVERCIQRSDGGRNDGGRRAMADMPSIRPDRDGVEMHCLPHRGSPRLGRCNAPPPPTCRRCPTPKRRATARCARGSPPSVRHAAHEHPDWWNAPVPAFGDPQAWLAIVGLAPGKHGANRTGRPFTGDYAGDLLYATLERFGLSEGHYAAERDDGLRLTGAIILNAVKCLPPQNKPEPVEIATCRPFLEQSLAQLPAVQVIIALGQIAHNAAARALGLQAGRIQIRPRRRTRRRRRSRPALELSLQPLQPEYAAARRGHVRSGVRARARVSPWLNCAPNGWCCGARASDDAPAMHAIMSDARAMRYWSSLPHETLAETERWIGIDGRGR